MIKNIAVLLKTYPKLSIVVFNLFLFFIMDFIGTKIYFSKNKKKLHAGIILGKEDPVYHHGFIENGKFEAEYNVYTNSLGFKDSEVRYVDRGNKGRRILFMGDSFTEGVMLPWDSTFVGMISNSLKGNEIEVLNAARASYSPLLYWQKINYFIEKKGLKVTDIIIFLDISDVEDEVIYKSFENTLRVKKSDHKPSEKKLKTTKLAKDIKNQTSKNLYHYFHKKLKNNLFITYNILGALDDVRDFNQYPSEVKFLRRLGPNKPKHLQKNYFRGNWMLQTEKAWKTKTDEGLSLMRKNIKKIISLSQKRDINIAIAIYPWPGQIIYDNSESLYVKYWEDFCYKHDIPFLNLFPDFLDFRKNGLSKNEIIKKFYIENDVHFNRNGNQIIADRFIDFFLKNYN